MFNSKGRIPCVGISLGVDRIFSVIKARLENEQKGEALRSSEIEVFIMAFGGKGFTGMLPERMEVARQLWDGGVKAEFSWSVKPKLANQFKAAESGGVPFAVILGEDELAAGQVKIKQLGLPADHPEKEGVLVDKKNLVAEVKSRLAKLGPDSLADRLGGVTMQE
jgi:histidyl-tRNA synthetase